MYVSQNKHAEKKQRSEVCLLYTSIASVLGGWYKMDYGCARYSSAWRSCLKKLDTVYTAGMRFATGAFCTKLILWRRNDVLRSATSTAVVEIVAIMLVLPSHINHMLLANNRLSRLYDRRSTSTRPDLFVWNSPTLQHRCADGPGIRSMQSALLAASQT